MKKQIKAMQAALTALKSIDAAMPFPVAKFAIHHLEEALAEALAEQPAQQEPEFFTHNVERPYDWSEWVCPDPQGYLMKCCDCGLVHEAEFGVVRYKSETEREDCELVDDQNLQAVFRMRRSEQWSPEDTAQQEPEIEYCTDYHCAGDCGRPHNQKEMREFLAAEQQEPVGTYGEIFESMRSLLRSGRQADQQIYMAMQDKPLYTSPPAQRTWVGLSEEEIESIFNNWPTYHLDYEDFARAIEAELREKNP